MNTKEHSNFFQGKVFAILGLLILLIVPNFVDTNIQIVFILILFYALCASCWNIVCGFVGELSLGHAVFLGVGAYISSLLLMDCSLSPWIGMFIAAAITAVFGVIVGLPCFRLHGPYFALTTIALGELIRIFVENNETVFGINIRGAMGLVLKQTGNQFIAFELANKITYYYVMVALVAVTCKPIGCLLVDAVVTCCLMRAHFGCSLPLSRCKCCLQCNKAKAMCFSTILTEMPMRSAICA